METEAKIVTMKIWGLEVNKPVASTTLGKLGITTNISFIATKNILDKNGKHCSPLFPKIPYLAFEHILIIVLPLTNITSQHYGILFCRRSYAHVDGI